MKENGQSHMQSGFPLYVLDEIPGPQFFRLAADVKRGLMYLASPYSSNGKVSKKVAAKRKEKTLFFTDVLLSHGIWVFSPIVYGASFEDNGYHHENMWWMRRDFEFFKRCDCMGVYCLDGWEESPGVKQEMGWALTINKPLFMITDGT